MSVNPDPTQQQSVTTKGSRVKLTRDGDAYKGVTGRVVNYRSDHNAVCIDLDRLDRLVWRKPENLEPERAPPGGEPHWAMIKAYSLAFPEKNHSMEHKIISARSSPILMAFAEYIVQAEQLWSHASADLEGILPEFEPSGDREHPAWKTLDELNAAINGEPA